jgi:hypothetical protein
MKTIMSMIRYKIKEEFLLEMMMIMPMPCGRRKCMTKEKKKELPLEMIMKASKL